MIFLKRGGGRVGGRGKGARGRVGSLSWKENGFGFASQL